MPGWRCWEVGAGGISVIQWLAEQVGNTGFVLATDIEVSWMGQVKTPTIQILRHDVTKDDVPAESFDLIHARLVLVHIRDRERVLHTLAGCLRPGGWLLIEDADPALQPLSCIDAFGADQELANKLRKGFRTLLSGRGVDLEFGRKLPRLLRQTGLVNVGADAYFPVSLPECAPLEIATIKMLRDQLISEGIASPDEIDRHLLNVSNEKLDLAQPPMISAWGRRQSDA